MAGYDNRRTKQARPIAGRSFVANDTLRLDQRDSADHSKETYRHAKACAKAVGGGVTPSQLNKMLVAAEHLTRCRMFDGKSLLLGRLDLLGCLSRSERCRKATPASAERRLSLYIRAARIGRRLVPAGPGLWLLRWHGAPPISVEKPVTSMEMRFTYQTPSQPAIDRQKRIIRPSRALLLTRKSPKLGAVMRRDAWQSQPRAPGGRFGPRTQTPPCRPEAGSEVRQAERPPCSMNLAPACNKQATPDGTLPMAEAPQQVVAGQKKEAAEDAVAHFLALASNITASVGRETSAAKQAEQDAYDVRVARARAAAAARRAASPRDLALPRRPTTAPTQPPPAVRRQQGVVVPPAALRVHHGKLARLADRTGGAYAAPNEAALVGRAATASELARIVPAAPPSVVRQLILSGCSAMAVDHAEAHRRRTQCAVRDPWGWLIQTARRYQAGLLGRSQGWSPYAGLRGAPGRALKFRAPYQKKLDSLPDGAIEGRVRPRLATKGIVDASKQAGAGKQERTCDAPRRRAKLSLGGRTNKTNR